MEKDQLQLLKKEQESLQLYSGLTAQGIAENIERINEYFPTLTLGFYKGLCERLKVNKCTDVEFSDAVGHVADTRKFSNPMIGDFISYIIEQRIPPEERPEEIQPITTDQEDIYKEKDRKFFDMLNHMDDDLTEEEKAKDKRFSF